MLPFIVQNYERLDGNVTANGTTASTTPTPTLPLSGGAGGADPYPYPYSYSRPYSHPQRHC